MSVLTDLIYAGSNAVAGLTEGAVNEAIEKYRLWLTDKYKTYLSKMVDLIASKDSVCQVYYK